MNMAENRIQKSSAGSFFAHFFGSALHNKLQLQIFIILTSFFIPAKAQVNPSMILWRKFIGGPNWGPYQTQNPLIWLKMCKKIDIFKSLLLHIFQPN